MSGLEDTLKGVLSDPESMGKIMELARSLGGAGQQEEQTREKPEEDIQKSQASSESPLSGLIQGLLGGGEDQSLPVPDPELTDLALKLFSAWSSAEHSEKAEILQALKTVSKPERQEKIDRALRAVRFAHLAHEALLHGEREKHHGF